MTAEPLTTWYLRQTAAADLDPAPEPESARRGELLIMRAEIPSPAWNRFLYRAVGADVEWTDRLAWTPEQWRSYVEKPGVETWVAYLRGTPAGYLELEAQDAGAVEIVYFGLLPDFRGRRIGGRLLTFGTARAWDLAERLPGRETTKLVWVHTCSKDGPYALRNYRRRGFTVFDTTTENVQPG